MNENEAIIAAHRVQAEAIANDLYNEFDATVEEKSHQNVWDWLINNERRLSTALAGLTVDTLVAGNSAALLIPLRNSGFEVAMQLTTRIQNTIV